MNVDILTQFPRLFKELQALIMEPLEKRREERRAFYEREIAPIHQTMEDIHKDYTGAFTELLELFDRQSDPQRAAELMRKQRGAKLDRRQDVRAFHDALETVKSRSYLKKRELTALREYAESIWTYLTWTGPGQKYASWFTHFISEFQSMANHGQNPYEPKEVSGIVAGRAPVVTVKQAYYDAVHVELPEAWQQYLLAYRKLKLEFTR